MTPEERIDKLLDELSKPPIDLACALWQWERAKVVIVDAIRAAEAEEREACARIAEETKIIGAMDIVLCSGEQVAAAIRARSDT
jgi:hypothetical protein